MTAVSQTAEEIFVELPLGKIHLLKEGTGSPLLILHHDVGNPGWLPFYQALARDFTVYVPSHPGFGKSDRPEWMRNVREMAIAYLWLLDKLQLKDLALVGLGFGGWIAADMAMMCQQRFSRLVLVAPMGIQPAEGEILDQFLINTIEYVTAGFADPRNFVALYGEKQDIDQLVEWEVNREMATRIAWKPNMFDQAMPHLIGSVATPSLIVWGDQDRIVPLSCAQRYQHGLVDARLEILKECGHFAEVERADELATLTRNFITAGSKDRKRA